MLAGEPDSEELARIKSFVDDLGVPDRMTYLLSFPEKQLPDLLKSASVAAFPSKGEGFGLALLEAMAAGVPLVANRIPAHELLLGSGLSGQLVDFGDANAAAGSIRALLEAGKGDLDALTAKLRARAADYDIERLRGQIDELYSQLRVRPRAKLREPMDKLPA